MEIRILGKEDAKRLSAYLTPRTDSSMILRSNLRASGVTDGDTAYHGCYAAALSGGRVRGVVAHYWNGFVIPQAPASLVPDLCRAAVGAAGRCVKGSVGPADQVDAVLAALGLTRAKKRLSGAEGLYTLPLECLRLPGLLTAQRIQARPVAPEDRELLVKWFQAYDMEVLGASMGTGLEKHAQWRFERHCQHGVPGYVLLRDGQPVSFAGFNATLPDAVQVGGVYTPPAERGRGFARAAVAHALRVARDQGVARGVLFTGDHNLPAIHAYRALGFDRVGDFRLTELQRPRRIRARAGEGVAQQSQRAALA